MRTLFWVVLPDEALILLIAAAGLLLILGFRGLAGSLLAMAVLLPMLAPFVEALMSELPLWVAVGILLVIGLAILRAFASLFLGRRAADHMVGILAADVVRLLVLGLLWPFRMLGRVCSSLLGGRVR
jgi:hypothetical protein